MVSIRYRIKQFVLLMMVVIIGGVSPLHSGPDHLSALDDAQIMLNLANGKNAWDQADSKHYRITQSQVLDLLKKHMFQTPIHQLRKIAGVIYSTANQYKLNPKFVVAVIMIESRFNSLAVSPKGAIGLLQIMPDTAQWLADRMGVQYEGPHTLFDPVTNIRMGVAYLNYLRGRYGNNMKAVLSAYNAGPGFVEKYLPWGGKMRYQLHYYRRVRSYVLADLSFARSGNLMYRSRLQ